ncbi:MAG: PEP-CTERM sorting domain-containing protein [Parvularculaceae bacterium]
MKMAVRSLIAVLAAAIMLAPASAATTVFASSVFSQNNVANATGALFAPDGAAAIIGTGGNLVLQYSQPLTGGSLAASLLPLAGSPAFNILAVSVGEVISGVATFSGEFVLVDAGAGGTLSADLTALCSSVSATGCSLLKIRNAGSFNATGAFLDGISGVSNAPEPAVWAMMLLGFIGVAWRMKKVRPRFSKRTIATVSI